MAVSTQFKIISSERHLLGEGPRWCERLGLIVWVDILAKKLWGYDWLNQTTRLLAEFNSMPGCVNPIEQGADLLVALEDGLYTLTLADSQLHLHVPISLGTRLRFNDGKCDGDGRLWVGSMHLEGNSPVGELFSVRAGEEPVVHLTQLQVSNGMAWSQSSQHFYFIDSPTRQVKAFDFDKQTGVLTHPHVAVQFDDSMGWPDGMCIDHEDKLWIAHWSGSRISRWDPKTGQCLQEIAMPTSNVTSLAFVGPQFDWLCVTTASVDHDDAALLAEPLAGHTLLFKLDSLQGVATRAYQL